MDSISPKTNLVFPFWFNKSYFEHPFNLDLTDIVFWWYPKNTLALNMSFWRSFNNGVHQGEVFEPSLILIFMNNVKQNNLNSSRASLIFFKAHHLTSWFIPSIYNEYQNIFKLITLKFFLNLRSRTDLKLCLCFSIPMAMLHFL